jgi:uncharacterized protein (DUF2336 family)
MTATTKSEQNQQSSDDLSLIDELVHAVDAGGVKERLRILQRVTDLFIAGSRSYSSEQIALFDDVLHQLAADIEVEARARLADRLADVRCAPPRLIRTLAFDNVIEVARPVLIRSEQLTDADLVENARTKSQEHLLAIAQRLKLSEAVTDVLVERGDPRVVRRVARNRGARFSLAGFERLTVRAQRDRRLTLTLGQRSDLPRQYFIKLLENASASVRARLEAANPEAAAAIRETVDEVASAMQRESRALSPKFSTAERDARRRHKAHPVTEANVHAPARSQEFEKAVVSLSRLGRFPVDLVERALLDPREDMILILGKAAGCSWMTTKELLLMQAAGRNMTPDDLERALERYKKLSQQTARNIIKFREQRKKVHARNPNDESAGKRDAGASSATATDDDQPAKPAASRPATASA